MLQAIAFFNFFLKFLPQTPIFPFFHFLGIEKFEKIKTNHHVILPINHTLHLFVIFPIFFPKQKQQYKTTNIYNKQNKTCIYIHAISIF